MHVNNIGTYSAKMPSNTCTGPFKEQDGSYFPPAYVQPYVMTAALLFGVVTPTIVLGNLLWRHEIILGVCTLGVYLLEVAAQLISETVYVRKGVCLTPLC